MSISRRMDGELIKIVEEELKEYVLKKGEDIVEEEVNQKEDESYSVSDYESESESESESYIYIESEDENEYGNVGDDTEDRERSDEEMEEDKDESREQVEQGSSMAVVLHEDKRYYPSALEVYGPEV